MTSRAPADGDRPSEPWSSRRLPVRRDLGDLSRLEIVSLAGALALLLGFATVLALNGWSAGAPVNWPAPADPSPVGGLPRTTIVVLHLGFLLGGLLIYGGSVRQQARWRPDGTRRATFTEAAHRVPLFLMIVPIAGTSTAGILAAGGTGVVATVAAALGIVALGGAASFVVIDGDRGRFAAWALTAALGLPILVTIVLEPHIRVAKPSLLDTWILFGYLSCFLAASLLASIQAVGAAGNVLALCSASLDTLRTRIGPPVLVGVTSAIALATLLSGEDRHLPLGPSGIAAWGWAAALAGSTTAWAVRRTEQFPLSGVRVDNAYRARILAIPFVLLALLVTATTMAVWTHPMRPGGQWPTVVAASAVVVMPLVALSARELGHGAVAVATWTAYPVAVAAVAVHFIGNAGAPVGTTYLLDFSSAADLIVTWFPALLASSGVWLLLRLPATSYGSRGPQPREGFHLTSARAGRYETGAWTGVWLLLGAVAAFRAGSLEDLSGPLPDLAVLSVCTCAATVLVLMRPRTVGAAGRRACANLSVLVTTLAVVDRGLPRLVDSDLIRYLWLLIPTLLAVVLTTFAVRGWETSSRSLLLTVGAAVATLPSAAVMQAMGFTLGDTTTAIDSLVGHSGVDVTQAFWIALGPPLALALATGTSAIPFFPVRGLSAYASMSEAWAALRPEESWPVLDHDDPTWDRQGFVYALTVATRSAHSPAWDKGCWPPAGTEMLDRLWAHLGGEQPEQQTLAADLDRIDAELLTMREVVSGPSRDIDVSTRWLGLTALWYATACLLGRTTDDDALAQVMAEEREHLLFVTAEDRARDAWDSRTMELAAVRSLLALRALRLGHLVDGRTTAQYAILRAENESWECDPDLHTYPSLSWFGAVATASAAEAEATGS